MCAQVRKCGGAVRSRCSGLRNVHRSNLTVRFTYCSSKTLLVFVYIAKERRSQGSGAMRVSSEGDKTLALSLTSSQDDMVGDAGVQGLFHGRAMC